MERSSEVSSDAGQCGGGTESRHQLARQPAGVPLVRARSAADTRAAAGPWAGRPLTGAATGGAQVIKIEPVGAAADIWSVGCLALELLTGAPPYFQLEPMSALFRIVQDDRPLLPDGLSPEMRDFLLLCFQKARPPPSSPP